MLEDLDPGETREWIEALESVLAVEGRERASHLLDELSRQARRGGAAVPYSANTPYLNTIAPEGEPPYPGDLEVERRIRSAVRWNAVAMVLRANRESSELGGHIASFQSAATLYENGFQHFWHAPSEGHGGDLVILLSTTATDVQAGPDGLTVTLEGPGAAPSRRVFDKVLISVGRRPNGRLVGAENAGVAVDERGFIPVDKQQRTNVPHIFAIGDVVGQPMLAHKATHEGNVAAEVAAGKPSHFDAKVIPSVAYTDPEVAWAGLTETEAKQAGLDYGTAVFPWAAGGRSLSLGRDEGITKLIFDEASGRLLGCAIVGPDAGDLIAEAVLAIEMGCDASDIGLTIHPHPTLSETIGLAAEAFEGTITDLFIPRTSPSGRR